MALLKIRKKGDLNSDAKYNSNQEIFAVLKKDEIGISIAAADRILQLVDSKHLNKGFLRIAIRGGGCSGLSIHYEISNNNRDGDRHFVKNGAMVVIDKKSLSFLGGATVHCQNYLGSQEFLLVNNPAAKQCSCGQSFSL